MKFTLRPWTISDLDSLVLHANDIRISAFMTDTFPHPYTEEAGRNFIQFATKDDPIHIFAIDIKGKACGGIGIHPQSDIMKKNAELGYWLAVSYWNQGIISEAIPMVLDFAFRTYDIDRVFARPFGSNLASRKVLEKNNFLLEGKFDKTIFKNGHYEDELVYAIRKQGFQSRF